MAVKIGSARIDENGNISGGKAGDQTGKEVSTQNWYLHSKGWRVFRCILTDKAQKIAHAMEKACANPRIGYDQDSRNSLYNIVSSKGFDPALVMTDCETDCGALVRVCCAYAGIKLDDFNTSSEASRLLKSGCFKELTNAQFTTKSDYLRRGDILVTETKGHTVVVLSDGPKAQEYAEPETMELGDRTLHNGSKGPDVKQLQKYLIELGYPCGSYGADGDFGDTTEMAVERFQKASKLAVDGVYGPNTHKAMLKALEAPDSPENAKAVQIIGGSCYVRSEPSTDGKKLGVVSEGDRLEYGGATSTNGWNKVVYKNKSGWVSGKYSGLEV